MQLERRLSDAPCREYDTWGTDSDGGGIWVSGGCRAEFSIETRGNAYGDNRKRRERTIVCKSDKYNSNYCRTGASGDVRLERQLSKALCREYDTRAQIEMAAAFGLTNIARRVLDQVEKSGRVARRQHYTCHLYSISHCHSAGRRRRVPKHCSYDVPARRSRRRFGAPGGRIDPEDHNRRRYARGRTTSRVRESYGEAVSPLREDLIWISHWTTPEGRPERYSTWLVAAATDDKVQIDGDEITTIAGCDQIMPCCTARRRLNCRRRS